MWQKKLLILCTLACLAHACHAQISDSTQAGRPSLFDRPPEDTIREQFYTTAADFYYLRKPITDSFDVEIQQYDPTRRSDFYYGHLGNLGSPHRAHYFEPIKTKGLTYAPNQFTLYRRTFGEFKFYDSETPITEFNYSQGLLQLDGILSATFGKNFVKGIKLSIDYQRVNQTGQYRQQRVKNTNLGVGIWYDAPGGKYDGLFYYGSNSAVQENNGGVINYDTLFALSDPGTVPVKLEDALTTNRERTFSVQNHFHVYDQDSSLTGVLFDIIHTAQYRNAFVKFSDEDIADGNEYYGDFLVDRRGMRHFIFSRSVDNRIDGQLRFGYRQDSVDIAKHLLRAGLQYRYTNLQQEPQQRSVNEVFLNASGRLSITDDLSLRGFGYLQFTGQPGDFSVDASLTYDMQNFGQLSGHASIYQRSPTVIEQALYISQNPVWMNDFDKPTYSDLRFKAHITRLKLKIETGLRTLANYIYYDTERLPIQLDATQEIWQVSALKAFRSGHLGLNIKAAYQAIPEELALPGWVAEMQFYVEDNWFKDNLRVRFGIDGRVMQEFNGINYFPATGMFHLDSSRPVMSYPALDIYFAMQSRTSFRAFFKIENFGAWFLEDVYTHVVDYPQFDAYFRFGLWMKLFN